MEKLTETNIVVLEAICKELKIDAKRIDEFGNIFLKEEPEVEILETKIFGIPITRKAAKRGSIAKNVITLQELMSKVLGVSYDPNKLVETLMKGVLIQKDTE